MTHKHKIPMVHLKDVVSNLPPYGKVCEEDLWAADVDPSDLERELGTGTYLSYDGWYQAFNERVTRRPVNVWRCTNEVVGVFAYYFDGEFVALSFQAAREDDISFKWVSRDAALRVREFILDLAGDSFVVSVIGDDDYVSEWMMTRKK